MAVALKNDGGQAKELVDDFDFAIIEQCFQYEECGPAVERRRSGVSMGSTLRSCRWTAYDLAVESLTSLPL
jgi:hypothetical protein